MEVVIRVIRVRQRSRNCWNILIKKHVLESKWAKQFEQKIQDLAERYGSLMEKTPGGDLILMSTCNNDSPVYLPADQMLCDSAPVVSQVVCQFTGCNQKALCKTCDYCADCCIVHFSCTHAKPSGEDIDVTLMQRPMRTESRERRKQKKLREKLLEEVMGNQ